MSKTKDKDNKTELPDFQAGGELPGEQQWSEPEGDEQLFVKLREPGETFDGAFIRLVKDGSEGLKYPGFLFAEYPSATLRVIPHNWSIGEKIAEKERENPDFWASVIVRITLREIVEKKNGTSVKLFAYQYMKMPKDFAPRWTEQFQPTPANVGQ